MTTVEPTAAAALADLIRTRVPDWAETQAAGLWEWASVSPDNLPRHVSVDGRTRIMPVAVAAPRGPLVVGAARDVIVSVELPVVVDRGDLGRVLSVLEAADVLPAEPVAPVRRHTGGWVTYGA